MIVIISDLHLTDGTTGQTIKENAFRISPGGSGTWPTRPHGVREAGTSRSNESTSSSLGDILDVTRSTAWLEQDHGPRPWSNPDDLPYIGKLNDITTAILAHNEPSLTCLRNLAEPGGLLLPRRRRHWRPKAIRTRPAGRGRHPLHGGEPRLVLLRPRPSLPAPSQKGRSRPGARKRS